MLLTHTVLTSHLASGTPNVQSQQPIGQTLVPLPHDPSPGNITLYPSVQSAPKKRKLSQDGLVHVKQVQRVNFFYYCHDYTKINRHTRRPTGREYDESRFLFFKEAILNFPLFFHSVSSGLYFLLVSSVLQTC